MRVFAFGMSRPDSTIAVDSSVLYTYPEGTSIDPGELILVTGLNTGRGSLFELYDESSVLVDSVTVPLWNVKTYGRVGTPGDEYSTWEWMDPTPGDINIGQVPIPEFESVLIPLSIVTIMFFTIMRRRRAADAASEHKAEGESHGSCESENE